jgi:hypothetical protein
MTIATLLLGPCQLATATVGPPVALHAALIPEHLGAGTTIKFAFTITPPAGQLAPPLRAIALRYPENLGIATSGLGVSTCRATALEAVGPASCPVDSVIGYGLGLAEVPFESDVLYESTRVTAFMAPLDNGNLALLFYADGESPVAAQLVFPAAVLSAPAPFGGDLETTLPLIPSVPGAPDVALLKLQTTIGPSHITYYEYAKHKTIPYHPRGILLPRRCPHEGFHFAAELTFANGAKSNTQTVVPCPPRSTASR